MSEEEKQKWYEALFNEGQRAIWEMDQEYAKFMGSDECWGWSADICGENCPDYHNSSGSAKK